MAGDEGNLGLCATCDEPIVAWPYLSIPQPDGSMAMYHQTCSPWAADFVDYADGGLELLTDEESQVVVGIVRALLDHDESELRRIGAIADDLGDPYEPARNWRLWPQVDLVMPPGDPVRWEASVYGPPGGWRSVDLRMWTVQEDGPSDLTLHFDVAGGEVLWRGMWA